MRTRPFAPLALGLSLGLLGACQVSPATLDALAQAALSEGGKGSPSAKPSPGAVASPGASASPANGSPSASPTAGAPAKPGTLSLPPDSLGVPKAFSVPANFDLEGTLLDGPNQDYTTLKVQIPEGADGLWTMTTTTAKVNMSYRLLDTEKVELELKYVDMGQGKGTLTFPVAGGRSYYFQWRGLRNPQAFTAEARFVPVDDAHESEGLDQAKPLTLGVALPVVLFQGFSRATGSGKDHDFFTFEVPAGKSQLRFAWDNPEAKATLVIKSYLPNAAGSPTHEGTYFGANAGANLNKTVPAKAGRWWIEVYNNQNLNSDKPFPLTVFAD